MTELAHKPLPAEQMIKLSAQSSKEDESVMKSPKKESSAEGEYLVHAFFNF